MGTIIYTAGYLLAQRFTQGFIAGAAFVGILVALI